MSLQLMYRDELKGFYKSKVMLFMWIGLPILALWIYLLNPESEQNVPLTVLSAVVVSSIAGTLSSIMLTVSIIHEKSKGVYPLFLIRPIKRRDILLGKFLAVFTCVFLAALISIGLGLIVDYFTLGSISGAMIKDTLSSLLISISMMGITCSAGILIGMISPSVLVGVLLVIYGGNQISALVMIPSLMGISNSPFVTFIPAILFSSLFLYIALAIFKKKQF